MRVSELMEQLSKLNPHAQVYMFVTDHTQTQTPLMSIDASVPNTCMLCDHVLVRTNNVLEIGGVTYEVVERVYRLKDKHKE